MVSMTYIGLYGLLLVLLSIYVIKGRRQYGAALLDNGNILLQLRIRAHQNYVEYTPLFAIMLFCAEYNSFSPLFIHILGASFLSARLLHAYSLLFCEKYQDGQITQLPKFRIAGMMGTFLCLAVCALGLIYNYIIS